jgi:hypothetical protein
MVLLLLLLSSGHSFLVHSAAQMSYRDLARLHRRKYRGPVEIYVTSGDTIYITDAEKTFFSSSIVTSIENDADCVDEDANERRGKSNHNHRKQVGLRDPTLQEPPLQQFNTFEENSQPETFFSSSTPSLTSPIPAHMEKYQIDLPTISLESYPNMSFQRHSTSLADLKPSSPPNVVTPSLTSPLFHDPLLNPPPNKVNEWPCGLMILVPLRLGLDSVNPMYYEVLTLSVFPS